jgi:hypothetical protein
MCGIQQKILDFDSEWRSCSLSTPCEGAPGTNWIVDSVGGPESRSEYDVRNPRKQRLFVQQLLPTLRTELCRLVEPIREQQSVD